MGSDMGGSDIQVPKNIFPWCDFLQEILDKK